MNSELHDLQSKFARLIGQLIDYVYQQPGWEVTFAEFTNLEHVGHMASSNHYVGLAADMNFFIDNVWQQVDGPEYQKLGAYWKSLDPDCRWGGDFKQVDLDHYSLGYQGRA